MDEQRPLAYFTPGKEDAVEQAHREDRRMTFAVLTIGGAMVLAVFVLPELASLLKWSRGAPVPAARPPALLASPPQRPQPSQRSKEAGSAKILMALEAYREERGRYPATLAQLRPRYLDARTDAARWKYTGSDDGREYQLHYAGRSSEPR